MASRLSVVPTGSIERRATLLSPKKTPRDTSEAFSFEETAALLHSFTAEITDIIEKGEPEEDKHGNKLQRLRVVFDDNRKLGVNWYHAADRISDIAILGTPAWITGLHGHNQGGGLKLASQGRDSLIVGPLGGERDTWATEIGRLMLHPLEVVNEIHDISMARQAYDMLKIHRALAARLGLREDEADAIGESRGAMTIMWMLAMAKEHGIHFGKVLAVDPCMHSRPSLEKGRQLMRRGPRELLSLGYSFGHVSLGRLLHYPNTVNPSPKSLIYEAGHAPTLFRGDAGKPVSHIEREQDMLILFFLQSIANQHPEWEEAFGDHPNVDIIKVPGSHVGGIMDERTMELGIEYFGGREIRRPRSA